MSAYKPGSLMSQNASNIAKLASNSISSDINSTFKVVVRVRPPLPREIEGGKFIPTVNYQYIVLASKA